MQGTLEFKLFKFDIKEDNLILFIDKFDSLEKIEYNESFNYSSLRGVVDASNDKIINILRLKKSIDNEMKNNYWIDFNIENKNSIGKNHLHFGKISFYDLVRYNNKILKIEDLESAIWDDINKCFKIKLNKSSEWIFNKNDDGNIDNYIVEELNNYNKNILYKILIKKI